MSLLRPVAPGVLVATSRRDATNSVVVQGVGRRVLLVDPAWTPDELVALVRGLGRLSLVVAAGFSTHAHFDHLLWHPAFGAGPRFASPVAALSARAERHALERELGPGHLRAVAAGLGAVRPGFPRVAGVRVVPIVHDAHSPGHAALWLPARRVLIAGDMLSDRELPLLDEGSGALQRYVRGLDALAAVAADARLVIPGHGQPGTDGANRVAADRSYLAALAAGRSPSDPRLGNDGMREAHAGNERIAAAGSGVLGRTDDPGPADGPSST